MDPHARKWRDYNPLKEIIFLSSSGNPHHMRGDSFLIPGVCHMRNVYCYITLDEPKEQLEKATLAFREFGENLGVFAEIDT